MVKQTKLRSTLLWRFLLLTLVPIAVLGFFAYSLVDKKTTENLHTKNQLLATSLASEVQESLRQPQVVLRQLAAVMRDYYTPEAAATDYLLDSAVENSSYFETIYLLDRQGRVLHVGLPTGTHLKRADYQGLDFSRMAYFKEALSGSGDVWSDVFLSPVTSAQSISLVHSFGNFLLVGNLNINYLSSVRSRQTGGGDIELSILDKVGTLIVQTATSDVSQRSNLSHLRPVKEGLSGHQGTWRFPWHGRDHLGSVAPVPATGWLVLVTQETEVAYQVGRQIRSSFMVAFALVLFLALLTSYTLSRRLVQPLHDLASQARGIASGEYQAGLPPQPHQEMEALAASFREMASEIDLRQAALLSSREHFLRLFNGGNDAVFVLGFGDDGLPSSFVELNDMACVVLGYERDELMALHPVYSCALFLEEPQRALETVAQGRRDGHVLFETELIARNGRRVPVEFNVAHFHRDGVEYALAVARDVSERRAAETALRHSEQEHRLLSQQFQALFDGIPDGLVLYDQDLTVVWANRGAGRALRTPETALAGKGCPLLMNDDEKACGSCIVERAFQSGQPEMSQHERTDGSMVELRAIPIRDEDGATVRVIEFAQDVTEQIRSQKETIRTGQLVAIGELAAGVAHEINNPINGIINYAQILANHAARGGDSPDLPERIIKEGNRIASIVSSLLSFSRKKQEGIKPVPLHEVISDSLTLMKTQLRKDGIRVEVDLDENLPPVAGRFQQIEQVLINLLSNARHALNARYSGHGEEKLLQISAEGVEDGMVRLVVHDHGVGMSSSLFEKIINPFFSTKPTGEGTGLGLSITHGIVTEHGGRMEFESEEGSYTRVIIHLPGYDGEASVGTGSTRSLPT